MRAMFNVIHEKNIFRQDIRENMAVIEAVC